MDVTAAQRPADISSTTAAAGRAAASAGSWLAAAGYSASTYFCSSGW